MLLKIWKDALNCTPACMQQASNETGKSSSRWKKPTWIDAGPQGMKFASFLSLILWRLLCTWDHNCTFCGIIWCWSRPGWGRPPPGWCWGWRCSNPCQLDSSSSQCPCSPGTQLQSVLHNFDVKFLPSYSLAAAVSSSRQEQSSCAHWQNLGLMSMVWSRSSGNGAWKCEILL